MAQREIAEDVVKRPYFEAVPAVVSDIEEGTRDMGEQYPFLICGDVTPSVIISHISTTKQAINSISGQNILAMNQVIPILFPVE